MKCRAEWDLTLALIGPLGCACEGARCALLIFFFFFTIIKKKSGEGQSLSAAGLRDSLSREERR